MGLNLSYPYQHEPKPKKAPLICSEDTQGDLLDVRNDLLEELCDLENLRFPTEKDNINKTLLLRKIQVLESELLRLSMNELSGKLLKLFGV